MFIHDTTMTLRAMAEIANTHPDTDQSGLDRLSTVAELDDFLSRHPYSGHLAHDEGELASVRAIRPRLLELWHVDRERAVPLVNAMLRDGNALPQLARHDDMDWHIHAAAEGEPLGTRMLVETGMAFIDVIRADAYDRVRVCTADDCQSVYVDFSKNGSKRYCDTGNCGNRMNVNAYRRRRAQENDE